MGSTQRVGRWPRRRAASALGSLLLMGLAGCAGCPVPGQRRLAEWQLFFGRSIPGGGLVDDAAWSNFAAGTLTPAFPDGFTVIDALGQWRDPGDGRIVRERSIVVEALGTASPSVVAGVAAAYRARFRQRSVGIVTREVCAAF